MATLSKPELIKPSVKQADIGAIARSIYEAFNQRDLDRAVSVVADECEYTELGLGQTYRGPDGLRANLAGWIAAFPDAQIEITNAVVQGDMVTIEYTGRGTNTGPFVGPDGAPTGPTGRRAETKLCDVLHFRGGKLVRGRSYLDGATIWRQLGLMPEPSSTPAQPMIRKREEGTALWFLNGLYEVKASSKETNGELCVMRMTLPTGTSAPPHVHNCGEAVFVLEGSLRLHVGERVTDVVAGDFAYFPKGTLEWMENASGSNASVLVAYTPGGMDEFFLEAAEPAAQRVMPPPSAPPDVPRLTAIGARHGLEIRVPTGK